MRFSFRCVLYAMYFIIVHLRKQKAWLLKKTEICARLSRRSPEAAALRVTRVIQHPTIPG